MPSTLPFPQLSVALAAFMLVLAACTSSDAGARAPSTTPDPTTSATITATATAGDDSANALAGILADSVADFVGEGPGGADVLIRRGGITSQTAAGTATAEGEALAPGRPFRVGSISKPFIATIVLQLVDEGLVDLDAPLIDVLPDTSIGSDTTIRQLLSHQSGIPNYTANPGFFPVVLADPMRAFEPSEVLDFATGPIGDSVGSFSYSNTNYILLGQLIEHLDGGDLNASLERRITEPIGLNATFFATAERPAPADLVAAWSPGVLSGEPEAPYTAIATSAWSAGALISTTENLAAFLDALFDGGLVSGDALAQMTATGADGYGLGLFAAQLGPGQDGFAHNGGIPGYSSTMAINPESGDTLVILTNSDALVADRLAPRIINVW